MIGSAFGEALEADSSSTAFSHADDDEETTPESSPETWPRGGHRLPAEDEGTELSTLKADKAEYGSVKPIFFGATKMSTKERVAELSKALQGDCQPTCLWC